MSTDDETGHETIAIKPGWIIRDCSSASGGVHYRRTYDHETQEGERRTVDFATHKVIDHVSIVKDLDALVMQAEYVLRKHCAKTTLGWFAPDAMLPVVRAAIARVHAEAYELNQTATRLGSLHRAYIGVAPLKVDLSTPEAAREIARTVHDTLVDILAILRQGVIGQELSGKLLRARHLDQLATGFQAEALRVALATIAEAKSQIRVQLKQGEKPGATILTPAEIGAALDLSPVEHCVQLFRPMDEIHAGEADLIGVALGR